MSDENTVRVKCAADGRWVYLLPDGSTRPLERMTEADWARFDAITDEEAYQNALDDPDNPPLTEERLAKMRRIPSPKKIRLGLNLSQEEFAHQFEISLPTLRAWEDNTRHLDRTAISYLTVITKDPDAVRRALGTDISAPTAATDAERRVKTA